MLEKRIEYEHHVKADGHIEVRRDSQIWEDGVMIGREPYHRHVIHPGQDTSFEDTQTKNIASVVHTPEIVAAFLEAERLRNLANA